LKSTHQNDIFMFQKKVRLIFSKCSVKNCRVGVYKIGTVRKPETHIFFFDLISIAT